MKLVSTLFFAGLMFLPGCVSLKPVYFSDDKRLAEQAVVEFHEMFNREAFHDIFESAHPEVKATKSEQQLVAVLSEIRSTLGRVQSAELLSSKVEVFSGTERKVEAVYRTQFEHGVRNEMFLWITDGS